MGIVTTTVRVSTVSFVVKIETGEIIPRTVKLVRRVCRTDSEAGGNGRRVSTRFCRTTDGTELGCRTVKTVENVRQVTVVFYRVLLSERGGFVMRHGFRADSIYTTYYRLVLRAMVGEPTQTVFTRLVFVTTVWFRNPHITKIFLFICQVTSNSGGYHRRFLNGCW